MTTLFEDDAETGDTSKWDDAYKTVVASGISGAIGTYCFDFTTNAGDGPILYDEFSVAPEQAILTFRGRYPSNADGVSLACFYHRQGGSNVEACYLVRNAAHTLSLYCLKESGGVGVWTSVGTSTATLADDTWAEFTIQYKPHATTGIAKLWINDTLEIDYSGETLWGSYTPNLKAFLVGFIGIPFPGVTGYSGGYTDEVEVTDVPPDDLLCTGVPPESAYGTAMLVDVGEGLVIKVNGVDVEKFQPESVTIEDELSTRSTCSFRVVDEAATITYLCGEKVEVYYDRVLLFAGTIDNATELYQGIAPHKFIDVQAVGWEQLASRATVTNSYIGLTLRELVAKVVYEDTWLGEEGVILGTADDEIIINEANYNYKKASDVFDDLGDKTGTAWRITPEMVLHFYDQSTNPAPFAIGEGAGASLEYDELRLTRDRAQYRNRQWIVGGHDYIYPIPEYIAGENPDATIEAKDRQRVFQVKYPISDFDGPNNSGYAPSPDGGITPGAELGVWKVLAGGTMVKQRSGLRDAYKDGDLTITDARGEDWRQWFYEYGKKELTQNSAVDEDKNPTLKPGEMLYVSYRALVPMVWQDENYAGIQTRKTAEGGTGIYEEVEQDDELDGRDLADERGQRLLEQFGRIPRTVPFKTHKIGLHPGQLMDVTIASHGLNAVQFMVDRVVTTFPGADYTETHADLPQQVLCEVSMLDGERQGGWTDFWVKSQKRGRIIKINEGTVVQKVKSFYEGVGVTDTVDTFTNGVTLHTWDEDPFSVAWIGVVERAATDIVCALTWGRSIWGEPYVPSP